MTKIKALHAQGASAAAILDLAQTDSEVQAELVRLLERNLDRSDDPVILSSQARFAMRLSTAAKTTNAAKGARHSEL